MATLDDFVTIALTQRGDPYKFGAEASFEDRDRPRFDCSELVQWAAARCRVQFVDGAQNQRDACQRAGTMFQVAEGIRTRGALLFRIDEGPGNDHVAISLGDGRTMEARGLEFGVNVFSATGRRWTHARAVPGFTRTPSRLGKGMLREGDLGVEVQWAQRRVQMHGFGPGPADGVFGPRTDAAVRAFQSAKGQEVGGVVGPETRRTSGKAVVGSKRWL